MATKTSPKKHQAPASPPTSFLQPPAVTGAAPKVRDISQAHRLATDGERVDLPGGGYFILRVGNPYFRMLTRLDDLEREYRAAWRERLEREYREAHAVDGAQPESGTIPPEAVAVIHAEVERRIPFADHVELQAKASLGTTIAGWGGFVLEGVELVDRTPTGDLHVANGVTLLSLPDINDEVKSAFRKFEKKVEAATEGAEKN
jgi:hypothetical protein